ncbi:hypothetical protein [Pseudomonas sp. C9-3]|uniref:hypothetical protein n=1 Tax=Pseudomonas sp. C9-3 TaxID=3078264 RepID=UPI0028E9E01E|nr:hypothetical protein [Pseudomonas sp. C9-3]
MKKIALYVTLASALSAFGATANAACTPTDVMNKVAEIQNKLQGLAATDPQKLQKLSAEMQSKAMELASAPTPDAACKYYDEVLKQL